MRAILIYIPRFLQCRLPIGSTRLVSTIIERVKLEERISSMPPIPRSNQSPVPVNKPRDMKSLISAGRFEDAWQLFTASSERTPFVYSSALNLCGKAGWNHRAKHIWVEIKQEDKDLVCYNSMIDACSRCKEIQQAEAVFAELEASALTPNLTSFSTMIKAYASVGRPNEAMQLFKQIPGDVFTSASEEDKRIVFMVLMLAFARTGDYATARGIFVDMMNQGLRPDNRHYNALLTACASAPHPEIAQAIFDQMFEIGLTPDVKDWSILMACWRNHLDKCKFILSEIQAAQLEPSGLAYQTLLEAHVNAGDTTGAKELLNNPERFRSFWNTTKMQKLKTAVTG